MSVYDSDTELCQWLRDNSSGDYRPSDHAADVIEHTGLNLQMACKELTDKDAQVQSHVTRLTECTEHMGEQDARILELTKELTTLKKSAAEIGRDAILSVCKTANEMPKIGINSYERGASDCIQFIEGLASNLAANSGDNE